MMSISEFKYGLLFILLIGTEGVYGQLSTNDSLMMKALSDSVNRYSFTEPDKALSFVEKKRMYSKSYTNKDHYLRTYIQEMNVNFLSNRLVNLSDNFKAFEAVFANHGQKCTKGEDLLYELDNLKSLYYFLLHDFKKAKLLINDGLFKFESKQKLLNEDYIKVYLLRLKNSEVNLHNGNFSAAIQDVESALTTLEKLKKTSSMLKLNLFVQLASIYGKVGKRKEADYYYTQSATILDSIKNNKIYNLQAISFYLSLAKSNILIQNFKKGTYCLKQISKLVDKNENQQKNVFRQLGLIKSRERNYSDAASLFRKALGISTKIYSSRHHESAQIDYELAKIYEKQNNPIKALAQTQAALIALSQQFNSTNYQDNPKIKDVFSKKDLLETLDFKAGLLLSMAKSRSDVGRDAINRVSTAYQTAYQTASLAAALIDTIRADYTSDFDKQYLADWSYGVYEKNIEAAFQLFQNTGDKAYVNAAFNALERSKAIVLLEALRTGQAESALSDDDRNRLYQFKSTLQKLETQIYDATTKDKKTPEDPSVRALQNQLFAVRRQYETLIQSFETRYPDYYHLKFGQKFAQLADIQRFLPNDNQTAALEYFVGDKAIYTFVITKNDCQIVRKDKDIHFETRIETMREALKFKDAAHEQVFREQATWLYDVLLKDAFATPVFKYYSPIIKKLIVMPDGILNYVPFEMLFSMSDAERRRDAINRVSTVNRGNGDAMHRVPTEIPNPKSDIEKDPSVKIGFSYAKAPFLIRQYTISYAYSANLLLMQNQQKHEHAPKLFAGFAAQYKAREEELVNTRAAFTRDDAYDLPFAQKEVSLIHDLLGGDLFTKNKATEQYFKENAPFYRILHFAMHAVPDSINPLSSRLLFTYNAADTLEDNDLTAAEIYAMRLRADLAVLSACQTGFGKINRGEGVMSLSRAFAYAGVNTTVMSLWSVSDGTTQEIMVNFYKNLQDGQAKDEALRNAKLAYLKKHRQNESANPIYWAGFVPAGNMSPMDMTNNDKYRWLVVGLLAVFVGLVLYLRTPQYFPHL